MIRTADGKGSSRVADPFPALGLLSTRKPMGRGVPGLVYSRRLRQQAVQKLREDLAAKQAPSAVIARQMQQLAQQIDRVADWLVDCGWQAVDALPAWPTLPSPWLVGAASTEQDLLGQDAVVLLQCQPPPEAENPQAFDIQPYAKAVASVVGWERVHIVEGGDCVYEEARTLVAQGEYALVMSAPSQDPAEQRSIDALASFFLSHGYPVDILDFSLPELPPTPGVNFANVRWLPEHDMLVLAQAPEVARMPMLALPRLVKAFGKPEHVLHVSVDFDALVASTPTGQVPLCYPLNMFFNVLQNGKGQWVALLNEDCVAAVHWLRQDRTTQQDQSLSAVLQRMGFTVLALRQKDLEALAGCGFSSPLKRGVYLVNRELPKALKERLRQVGIRVQVPKTELGLLAPPYGPFGLCSVLMEIQGDLTMHQKDEPPAQDIEWRADETEERTDL